MKSIAILSHNLGGNALSRAYTLATMLQGEYRVEIVGPSSSGELWAPVQGEGTVDFRMIACGRFPGVLQSTRRFARQLSDADLLVAVKPMAASFGLGLRVRKLLGIPLLLDIDDWEPGFLGESLYWEARLHGARWLWDAQSPLFTRVLDRRVPSADAVTVSSDFLRERYGGTWIGQPRDERQFPGGSVPVDRTGGRRAVFMGSVREHKGLGPLLSAWSHVRVPDATLHVVGTPLDHPLVVELRRRAPVNVFFAGTVPFDEVPRIVGGADVVVIPQQPGRASIGQVPMKLVDAMAMGRPIVAGNAGDIPKWLGDDSGIVVDATDEEALGAALNRVLSDDSLAEQLGVRARRRFLELGSFEAIRPRLFRVVDDLLAGRRPVPGPSPFERVDGASTPWIAQCGNVA